MFIDNAYSHKPSCSIWKSMTEFGYAQRMARVFDCFFNTNILDLTIKQFADSNIKDNPSNFITTLRQQYSKIDPINANVVADIGSGPWCGIFFLKQWPVMYSVDPAHDVYKEKKLTRDIEGVTRIQGLAEQFVLPQKSDIIWCINALNHGGCLKQSLQNIMNNLNDGGLLLLHLHLRTEEQCDSGHPMPVLESELDAFFKDFEIMNKNVLPDPLKPNRPKPGRRTYLATIKKK